MSFDYEVAVRDLSFAYPSALEPLFTGLTVHFPRGFTGIVGANGAGKSTLLQVVTGGLTPSAGVVVGAADAIYCEQRTDAPPPEFVEFLDDYDTAAFDLRGRLGITPDYLQRWDRLSHGERKRAQIAHALWRRPNLLAIDEPTNHIDAQARALLVENLRRFHGVGLIVSHDRELLDELCPQCLWLEPPNGTIFPGNFTQAREQRSLLRTSAQRDREKVLAQRERLRREVARRADQAAGADRARSKRGLSNKDHDAKEKIDRALVSGKDGQAGRALRQLSGRAAQLEVRLQAVNVTKTYETGIWLPGAHSRRDQLFTLAAGEIALGSERRLHIPVLSMRPADRISLTGVNGSGKSSLLQHVLRAVQVPEQHLVVMPQELALLSANQILNDARALPNDVFGRVLNIVSRLGSRPHRLLESRQPSPGEVRKLLLALGMARTPHLIVMDEPTNHLDLPSIEALEEALADCPCGLLLVSHDQRFLDRLVTIRWHIEVDRAGNATLDVR